MKHILTIIVLSMLFICGCSKEKIKNGSVINERGTYRLAKGVQIEIFTATNDLLNIRHTYSNGNFVEWVDGIIENDDNWFIYISSWDEIWVATEDDLILLYESNSSSGNYSIFNCKKPETINPHILSKMPSPLMDMINEELRIKIKTAQPAI